MSEPVNLHIMEGMESIRVFADNSDSKPPFVGHKHVEFGSEEYTRLVSKAQKTGAGVFFSVNRTDGKGAKAENIVAVRTYYVDIDGLEDKNPALEKLITAKLKPSAIVETKNGVHAYWYAADSTPVNYARYRDVQLGLIKAFDGDESAKDIARVLRVPGTLHLKEPRQPFLVRIVHQLPKELTPYYTAEEILDVYPAPQRKSSTEVIVKNSPKAWDMFLSDLSLWEPIRGERNNVMLLSAGVAIAFGVDKDTYIETMKPVVGTWRINRNISSELARVANWAYDKGNPIPPAVLRSRGVPIRREL